MIKVHNFTEEFINKFVESSDSYRLVKLRFLTGIRGFDTHVNLEVLEALTVIYEDKAGKPFVINKKINKN